MISSIVEVVIVLIELVPWVLIAFQNGDTGEKLLTMIRMFFYKGRDGNTNTLLRDKILLIGSRQITR
jgi:hypothetical protein